MKINNLNEAYYDTNTLKYSELTPAFDIVADWTKGILMFYNNSTQDWFRAPFEPFSIEESIRNMIENSAVYVGQRGDIIVLKQQIYNILYFNSININVTCISICFMIQAAIL